jgi:hypothetical protein
MASSPFSTTRIIGKFFNGMAPSPQRSSRLWFESQKRKHSALTQFTVKCFEGNGDGRSWGTSRGDGYSNAILKFSALHRVKPASLSAVVGIRDNPTDYCNRGAVSCFEQKIWQSIIIRVCCLAYDPLSPRISFHGKQSRHHASPMDEV